MKVFLSHSSVDKNLARRLSRDLRSANVDVWLDQWEIGVGAEIVQSIERGIDEAEFVVVLLTLASVASDWVNREWRRKIQNEAQAKRIAVVPVRGEPCEVPDFLAQRSHADISGGSYPLGFRHLLTILRHYSVEVSDATEFTRAGEKSSFTRLPVVTPIALEVSSDLIPIFEPDSEGANRFLDDLAPQIRHALHAEFGFPFPGIRIRGVETDMPPSTALLMFDEIPEVTFQVSADDMLVDATVERLAELGIKGQPAVDLSTDSEAARIGVADLARAQAAGLATLDAAEYVAKLLQSHIRRMASLFLDVDVTRRLVDCFERTAPELVAQTVPKAVSWFELADVLTRLVEEEIGIADIGRILEALSQGGPHVPDTVLLTERVRHALSAQITMKYIRGRNSLSVLLLDSEIEALISSGMKRNSVGSYLELDPKITQDILAAIREQVSSLDVGVACVQILVTVAEVRRYIRNLVKLEFPSLHVLSKQDLQPDTEIQIVAHIRLNRTPYDANPTLKGLSA
jgi:type III secretory pathway component EscV